MVMNGYVVSAKKPTAVMQSLTGAITAPDDLNLILGKTNRIELSVVGEEGLRPIIEIPLFGRIATLNVFRVKGESVDSILVVTAKQELAILAWDPVNQCMRTRASGNISEKIGRFSNTGFITTVHSSGLIAVRIYDHSISIIRWEDGLSEMKELKAYQIRVEDKDMIDLTFLASLNYGDLPRLCYIFEDRRGRHLKFIDLLTEDKDIKNVHKQSNIESASSALIPLPSPYGGCIVLGHETILYTKEDRTYLAVAPPHMDRGEFTCVAPIDKDKSRILIGDSFGNLFMLVIDMKADNEPLVVDMKMEYLGEINIATTLCYLDNGVVYIGSRLGDSQLIRVSSHPLETGGYLSVIENFPGIGPVRDMVVMESDGLTHIIACCGANKEGSLRVIRNGIGIEECASVDLSGVKGLFSLNVENELDDYLVVSLAHDTHILHISGEELEDTQLNGVETEDCTLWCGVYRDKTILQICPSSMRLAQSEGSPIVWTPPKDIPSIGVVSVNQSTGQILIACGAHLFYFEVQSNQFVLVKKIEMNEQISCVNINPTNVDSPSRIASIGLWREMSVVILTIPDLEETYRENVSDEVVARSTLVIRMEDNVYVLCAMGDGTLFYYILDEKTNTLRERKKATLGTQPTILHTFKSNGNTNVFACSDRPAVLYSSGGKIVFSNVNLKLVTQMCSLNSQTYRNSLVVSDGETLIIGRIDDIQKLHIRRVSMGENVSRIAYQSQTNTLGVLTYRDERCARVSCSRLASTSSTSKPSTSKDKDDHDSEVHSIMILDANTFEILHAHELKYMENATSIISTTLGDDPTSYYIVGTASIYPDEVEPKIGRILVFECQTGEHRNGLRLIHEKEVKGAPYCLATLSSKLIANINSSVRLLEWSIEKELKLECSHFNYISAVTCKTKGDLLIVGDLMRSLCLINYKSMESALEESARHFANRWITSCEILDGETFVSGDANLNIFSVEKDRSNGGEERQRLIETGAFYLGEMINVFRRGTLVSNTCTESLGIPIQQSLLYGTVEGGIGVVLQLNDYYHKFFSDVEMAIASKITNCLRNEHVYYRGFHNEKYNGPKMGFIDGDLIEGILDLPRDKALDIVSNVKLPGVSDNDMKNPEEVLKLIEEMSRLH